MPEYKCGRVQECKADGLRLERVHGGRKLGVVACAPTVRGAQVQEVSDFVWQMERQFLSGWSRAESGASMSGLKVRLPSCRT